MKCTTLSIFAAYLAALITANIARSAEYNIAAADAPVARILASVIKEAYKDLGYEVKFHYRPFKRSLEETNKGIWDAELARISGTENTYENLVRVPEPIYSVATSVIISANSAIEEVSWDTLEQYRYAYILGYQIVKTRTVDFNNKGETVSKTDSIADMLAQGRIDVGVLISAAAKRLARERQG